MAPLPYLPHTPNLSAAFLRSFAQTNCYARTDSKTQQFRAVQLMGEPLPLPALGFANPSS